MIRFVEILTQNCAKIPERRLHQMMGILDHWLLGNRDRDGADWGRDHFRVSDHKSLIIKEKQASPNVSTIGYVIIVMNISDLQQDSNMASNTTDYVRYSVPVSLELDKAVRKRIREGGFSSVAEYVRATVRADLKRAKDARLEELLLEGLESGEGVEVTPEYFAKRRRALKARLSRRDDGG